MQPLSPSLSVTPALELLASEHWYDSKSDDMGFMGQRYYLWDNAIINRASKVGKQNRLCKATYMY